MTGQKRRALDLIAGRDRIGATEAAAVFGWRKSRTGNLAEVGIEVDADGTCSARQVLSAVDRRAANRRAASTPAQDATLELGRDDWNSWHVRAPWGPLGWITVTRPASGPLASPPRLLTVWIAEGEDGRRAGAVSARAAQLLLARWGAPQIVEPSWGAQVRELDDDLIDDVHAMALALHHNAEASEFEGMEPVPVPEHRLTDWEVEHITAAENPVWRAWRRSDVDGPIVEPAPLPTPSGLALSTRNNPASSQWGIKAVALHLRVAESTVKAWRSRGQMPDADGTAGRSPWWHPATITAWEQARPGRGRWGKRA